MFSHPNLGGGDIPGLYTYTSASWCFTCALLAPRLRRTQHTGTCFLLVMRVFRPRCVVRQSHLVESRRIARSCRHPHPSRLNRRHLIFPQILIAWRNQKIPNYVNMTWANFAERMSKMMSKVISIKSEKGKKLIRALHEKHQ